MSAFFPFVPGRGAAQNPAGRFERLHVETDQDAQLTEDDLDRATRGPRTQFFLDDTQTILTRNDSPDVGFDVSLNPYRGCEHGCAYCYARPTHEYLGWGAGLDFESRILVKRDAPALLRRELMSPRWQPQVIDLSGVTDCYQLVERRLRLTRACLEVLLEFRNPVGIVTKNHLVTRDADLLSALAKFQAAIVYLSITTLDPALARRLEPRASPPARRLAAIRELRAAGVPVGVSVAPIIPGLNDHEIPAIVQAAAEAGALGAFYTVVRLPYGLKDLFGDWLDKHAPGQREKILGRIRSLRGGALNDSEFGRRMTGAGPAAEEIRRLFRFARRRAGLEGPMPALTTAAFRRPAADGQGELFG